MSSMLAKVPERFIYLEQLKSHMDACRSEDRLLALLMINFRNLWDINFTYGFRIGDLIVSKFVERTQEVLRESDTIARIGESDFAIILPSVMNRGHAILAVNKVLGLLKEPFHADGRILDIDAQAGVSFFPEHAEDPELLTQRAAHALCHAQSTGNPCETYNFSSSTESISPVLIKQELSAAINAGDLMMHYQPQINLKDQSVCGVESLLRWESATLGIMNPEVFIPVAEKNELISPLTQWTLNTSIRNFIESKMHSHGMKISVNLSAALLHDDEIIDIVIGAMSIWGAKPEDLVLEVTESAIMTNPKKSLEILQRLNDVGIGISIDDFGTGYSSLSYLKHMPVKEIKIDKSFVIGMIDNEDDRKIVRSIIDLGHNFDLNVVAEGIEDGETLSLLTEMGCDIGQGYFIGCPMSLENFQKWKVNVCPWKIGSQTKTGT